MKKLNITIILLLSLNLHLLSQTCYETMLTKAKKSIAEKEYKRAVNIVESIIVSCEDIPKNNPLESIKRTALAFDSIDNIAIKQKTAIADSIKLAALPKAKDKVFIDQIAKDYGLDVKTDILKIERIEFDFNNDGLKDIAMLFYFEKKINSKIKKQVNFMNIAVFEQSKTNTYTLKNRADNNNLLEASCQLESLGIKSFEKIENGIFFFSNADKKCTVKCKYDTKTNKIQQIK